MFLSYRDESHATYARLNLCFSMLMKFKMQFYMFIILCFNSVNISKANNESHMRPAQK